MRERRRYRSRSELWACSPGSATASLGGPPDWFERLVLPRGHRPDPKLDKLKHAVAEDVAEMEAEDRRYFEQGSPGKIEDDL